MVSFSSEVKEEIGKNISPARHCQIAELAAVLSACGRLKQNENEEHFLHFQTENEALARKYFTLLKKTFNIDVVMKTGKSPYLKKGNIYVIEVSDQEKVRKVLQGTKLVDEGSRMSELTMFSKPIVTQKVCCKRAFIRGAFLAAGSISDPEKGYHFEIVCAERRKAEQIQGLIQCFDIDAKIVVRNKSHVVYVKEGAQIVELLAVMEANVSLMNLENIRIVKEMRNSVNRKVNCETANIHKTVNAAVRQVEDIRLVEEKIGLENLNEGLAEIAELRLKYPEATLKELGMMLCPQVGKSGVNHRLRKLSELAKDLRRRKEENLL